MKIVIKLLMQNQSFYAVWTNLITEDLMSIFPPQKKYRTTFRALYINSKSKDFYRSGLVSIYLAAQVAMREPTY